MCSLVYIRLICVSLIFEVCCITLNLRLAFIRLRYLQVYRVDSATTGVRLNYWTSLQCTAEVLDACFDDSGLSVYVLQISNDRPLLVFRTSDQIPEVNTIRMFC